MDAQHRIPPEIVAVVDKIVEILGPEAVYLFSNKRGPGGKTTGFKLLVVAERADRADAERELYVKIDSDVPFDVVVYSPREFADMRESEGSFATKIAETGVMLYGQTAL